VLLVSSGRNGIKFGLNDLFHLADPTQVRIDVTFFLAIKYFLAVQIHFKTTIGTWRQRNRNIPTVRPKELVRHPRGGCVMLSSDTVDDVNQRFPFFSHAQLLILSYLYFPGAREPWDRAHSTYFSENVKQA
jgi:hypothetical protein